MKDWVLIANKSHANIYQLDNVNHKLTLLKKIENETARLKEKDLISDAPGFVVNSVTGPGGRDLVKENKAKKHIKQIYTHKISNFLKKEYDKNNFNHLYVFAGPSLIGDLTSEFRRQKVYVSKKINKDLTSISEHELCDVVEHEIF